MNKGVLIGLLFLYLILIVYVSTMFGVTVDTAIIGSDYTSTPTDIGFLDLLKTFWGMITFDIDIPWVLNAFLIYPPVIIIAWQILEVIRG